jgi:methylated-DNA-protein-cysteine methyltransferase-like protein
MIPPGKFTTYGSIAVHMNIVPRHVAFVLSRLTKEESQTLPWHRVVGADARISPKMDAELAASQRQLLEKEGLQIDSKGFIQDDETHFYRVGSRRNIRWSEGTDPKN